MYIPDPTEIIESNIERQIDLVKNDKFPCYYCEKKIDITQIVPVTNSPDSPGMCWSCADIIEKKSK